MYSILSFILFTLLVCSVQAKDEQVVMLFGRYLAPYVIEKDNSGVELQIIREALASEGYELKPVYAEFGRMSEVFSKTIIDGVHSSAGRELIKDGFFAEVSVEYHDVFFTLAERNIVIHSPEDLRSYSLLAFQDADKHYPEWLAKDYSYTETGEQLDQVKLLQLGLVDVVLSDQHIFSYYSKIYQQHSGKSLKPMRLHNFTGPYQYRPVFKSQEIALALNRGLKKLKSSGRYQALILSLSAPDPAIVID